MERHSAEADTKHMHFSYWSAFEGNRVKRKEDTMSLSDFDIIAGDEEDSPLGP